MLNITLISVSHKQPAWVNDAYSEYAKRLPSRELKLEFKEIKPEPREGKTVEHAMAQEAVRINAVIPRGAHVIALDERGQDLTSVGLAKQLLHWQHEFSNLALIVGGADGLDPSFKASCHGLVRLSSLTMPHGMVRVLLAEQIYRAVSINNNHPYHRV
ncbi:23S rRNA (pseudouridine1915-N3)-methyltransferase [Hydromonas duriensis]|uniref:Ribosomal RNA large subunit methyltransferase H n=1 Tax=Hydromonas duriensis TaxID=1527608 RepID=A0A4R6Y8I4_9BURK|nr:23S rRNA (pseudouridine1915-N3)-methyltransferase [Hydromonas duriensis]